MSESVELAWEKVALPEVEWRRMRGSSCELLSSAPLTTATFARFVTGSSSRVPAKRRSGELLSLTRGGRCRFPSFLIAGGDSAGSWETEGDLEAGGGRQRTASMNMKSLVPRGRKFC